MTDSADIKMQIQGLLNKRIIRPTPLLCGAPLVLAPEKNDKHFLECVSRSCFHQSRVVEGDIWKTTFKTKQDLFEWLVMLFGFFHAPTTFTRMKKYVLKPFLDRIVYLDDIFIFIKFHYEHVMCEKKILDVICQEHMFLNMSKYMLAKTSLMYLSHEIGSSKRVQVLNGFLVVCVECGEGELKIDLSKIEAVIVCGVIESIPAYTGEGIIHPREVVDTFSLLAIYAGNLKIVIWIRGFFGATQC